MIKYSTVRKAFRNLIVISALLGALWIGGIRMMTFNLLFFVAVGIYLLPVGDE